jgi:hypothetical protein
MHSSSLRVTMHGYMNTPIRNLPRKVLLLSSAVAFITLLPSCLPPPLPYRARVSVRGPGYYDSLPSSYRGDYYQHGARYYYGGRRESGRFLSDGRVYGNRYSHGGQYYYGGQYYRPRNSR